MTSTSIVAQVLEAERDSAKAESDHYKQMHDSEADSAAQSRAVKQQLEYQVGVLESQVCHSIPLVCEVDQSS